MEVLRVWMMLLSFYFAITQARSINTREKEGEVLQRAVRDLFMIYQQERITTRLVGVLEGLAGKPLNESDYHVTKASGQLSLSDGNRSEEISDISAPLLNTDKPDTDDEKIDLLLRLYAILRKHSIRSEDSEINVSDDDKSNGKLWGEFKDGGLNANYDSSQDHFSSISLNEAITTVTGDDGGRNENERLPLANKTVTNGEWQYVQSSTDSLSKIREDVHMTLGNETRASGDDVDPPSFDSDDDVASVDLHEFINNVSSREYSRSNDDEPDLEYLLGSRSGEKEDDTMETKNVSRGDDGRFDEYDFISFKRSEVDMYNMSVNVLGNDNSTNNTISNTNSLDEVDYNEVKDADNESYDDDDGDENDDDNYDDEEDYDKNPNDTEHRSANDNQGTPNHPIIRTDLYDHVEHLDEVVDDHGDDHGRTFTLNYRDLNLNL